jgi:hypothetical protein
MHAGGVEAADEPGVHPDLDAPVLPRERRAVPYRLEQQRAGARVEPPHGRHRPRRGPRPQRARIGPGKPGHHSSIRGRPNRATSVLERPQNTCADSQSLAKNARNSGTRTHITGWTSRARPVAAITST